MKNTDIVNRLLIMILFTILFIPNVTLSETKFQKEGTFHINIYGSYAPASSFYNYDGNIVTVLKDYDHPDSLDYNYTFTTYTFGISGEYFMTDNWAVSANIPIGFYSLTEKYEKDKNDNSRIKADLSIFKPQFFGLGSKYLLFGKTFSGTGLFELRIPSGFHNGILSDSTYEFLNDGAFEVLGGIGFDYKLEKSRLEADFLYNHRAEELGDRIMIHAEGALMTVPNTELMVFSNVILPLETIDSADIFDIRQTPLNEMYTTVGFAFKFHFNEQFYANFSYDVRLLGRNSWNFGIFTLSAGFIF